jgi:hypothetical protein
MKTFWGLLASFIAVLSSVVSVTPVDIWLISPSAPTPEPRGCDAGSLASSVSGYGESLIQIRTPPCGPLSGRTLLIPIH